jgi:hypothetical protein
MEQDTNNAETHEKITTTEETTTTKTTDTPLTKRDYAVAGVIMVAAIGGAMVLRNPAIVGAAALKLGLKKAPVLPPPSRFARLRARLGGCPACAR